MAPPASTPSRRGVILGAAAAFGLRGRMAFASAGGDGPFPSSSATAESGLAFASRVAELSDGDRYAAAVEQVLLGNVPAHLRYLSPVVLHAPAGHTGARVAVIRVTSDYLAVGHAADFLRVPLDLHGARHVSAVTGFSLPTPLMVDAIFEAAVTRLTPQPLPPTNQMRSMAWTTRHNALIAQARARQPLVPLIAGHKKDVVLTNRLAAMPDRVAIYGWHQPTGRPIQPLSLVHGASYADYSHGIRLVHPRVRVDGVERDLVEALQDPAVAPLLTREGRISDAARLTGLT